MMGSEKTLVNVKKGQDPYSVIGNYISNHITAIEDMIAVIQINGVIIKELYMVNVDAVGYFYWKSDWWEGEENVSLLDFFPVSDAERIKWIPCSERLPEEDGLYLVTDHKGDVVRYVFSNNESSRDYWIRCAVAWMPSPESYKEE